MNDDNAFGYCMVSEIKSELYGFAVSHYIFFPVDLTKMTLDEVKAFLGTEEAKTIYIESALTELEDEDRKKLTEEVQKKIFLGLEPTLDVVLVNMIPLEKNADGRWVEKHS